MKIPELLVLGGNRLIKPLGVSGLFQGFEGSESVSDSSAESSESSSVEWSDSVVLACSAPGSYVGCQSANVGLTVLRFAECPEYESIYIYIDCPGSNAYENQSIHAQTTMTSRFQRPGSSAYENQIIHAQT